MTALTSVVYFLASLVFSLVIYLLWIRVFLRYFRVSALNPVSQNIYFITNQIVHPIEQLLPKNIQSNRYDWPTLISLVLIEIIKCFVLVLLLFHQVAPFLFIVLYTLVDLVIQPCNLLFYTIIIRVVISWVNPGWRHPIAEIIYLITEPLLLMGRRILPNFGPLDLSPLLILIVLKAITIFLTALLPIKNLI